MSRKSRPPASIPRIFGSHSRFHREGTLASALNRHAISFQSDVINSPSDMIPMGGTYYGLNTGTSTVILPGNSSMVNTSTAPGMVHVQPVNSSASSLLLDSPGLKHDTGLAVEWSYDEQCKLEEGLVKYADEPSIMRYIKIVATLRDKTVRDVSLRCRWLTRKRRKGDDYNLGKKVNHRKDKLVESSSKMNVPSAIPQNLAGYPLMMHRVDQGEPFSFEVNLIQDLIQDLIIQLFERKLRRQGNQTTLMWKLENPKKTSIRLLLSPSLHFLQESATRITISNFLLLLISLKI